LNEAEKIATKVSRDFQKLNQLVVGNGSKSGSVIGRLESLETAVKDIIHQIETHTCIPGCQWQRYMEREEEMKEKRRNWRIGDVANYVQLVMLLLLIYGLFK